MRSNAIRTENDSRDSEQEPTHHTDTLMFTESEVLEEKAQATNVEFVKIGQPDQRVYIHIMLLLCTASRCQIDTVTTKQKNVARGLQERSETSTTQAKTRLSMKSCQCHRSGT